MEKESGLDLEPAGPGKSPVDGFVKSAMNHWVLQNVNFLTNGVIIRFARKKLLSGFTYL